MKLTKIGSFRLKMRSNITDRKRISILGEMGVKNISTVMFTILDKKGMMRAISEEIMPHFQN